MKSLEDIQNQYQFKTDKNTGHSYLKHYDRFFLPFKQSEIKLLEIGIFAGGSIMLWDKYFEHCHIFGIDKNIANIKYDEIFNKNNIYIISKNFDTISDNFFGDIKFDIIIDDGSHTIDHQLKSLNIFRNKLNKNGILIIEDISSRHNNYQYFSEYIKKTGECELLDLRNENGVEDNILLIYKNK